MEGVKAREVLYETRNHATRPYKSNYPTQRNEDGKGVSSSLISVSGERVAVATGNQITILRKEDDYQEPYGIFTSSNLGTFVHGVWSGSLDILGIADDNDVLYFIKANGEEITRVMKRQLKTTSPITGLIPHDSIDACGSCLCSFIILTEDGVLYHIEINQAASISFMHTSNIGRPMKG
ncbi:hypothetical protein JCGZ_09832 [Jatropha curcas]|uniref:Uncharacterized protein n=1 Tax=Jatropha curcas TaxID=180498 RepID=A0A067KJJ2_JATCU|nr:hypothetical protein JCGZ_09832 [Jatropha curcas]